MADRPQPRQAAHPTPFTYLKVAIILAALTGIEVAVFYVDVLEPVFLPLFLILSVIKFAMVVLFYMHLKFDARLFSGVFVGGLVLAITVTVALMSLFQVLSTKANPLEVEVVASEAQEVDTAARTPPVPSETAITEGGVQTETTTPEEVETEPSPTADFAAMGKDIFLNVPDSVGPQALWCGTCHQIEGISAGLIGPDLTHIGTDAATRVSGMSAEAYLRESIRSPESFVAEGVERATLGLMTSAITMGLTDEQVDALVALLLEQK